MPTFNQEELNQIVPGKQALQDKLKVALEEGGGDGGGLEPEVTALTIGTNTLDDASGFPGALGNALKIKSVDENVATQLQIWQDIYSNPVTSIGGIVPFSDLDEELANYGTKQGIGTTNFKFPVGFNGQVYPQCSIDILSDEPDIPCNDPKIRIVHAGNGGFTTVDGSFEGCDIEIGHVVHQHGELPFTHSAIQIDAVIENSVVGDVCNAIWVKAGITRLDDNVTIGQPTDADTRAQLTVYTDGSVFQGSTTTAQAAAVGTLLDLRQGAGSNFLGLSNPDSTNAGLVINNVSQPADAYITYRRTGGSFQGWQFGGFNQTLMRLSNTGLAVVGAVGFNNQTPQGAVSITGSRDGNAALASLLTFLALRGDITDGTSA
jgi:hypothetical protein